MGLNYLFSLMWVLLLSVLLGFSYLGIIWIIFAVLVLGHKTNLFKYFTIYLWVGGLFYLMKYLEQSTFFLGGGDDSLFFELSSKIAGGESIAEIEVFKNTLLLGTPYIGHVVIQGVFFKVFLFLGLQNSAISILLFKSILNSWALVLLENALSRSSNFSRKYFMFAMFVPTVIFSVVFGLRESTGFWALCIGIYGLSQQKLSRLIPITLISFIFLFFIRRIAILVLFFFLFTRLHRRGKFLLALLALILVQILPFDIVQQIESVGEIFSTAIAESSGVSSLGARIYGLNNIFFPVKLAYSYLSPIPPYLFGDLSFLNIIFFLSDIVRYILLLSVLLILNTDRKFMTFDFMSIKSILVAYLLVHCLIVMTTRNYRHADFMLPIVLYSCAKNWHTISKNLKLNVVMIVAVVLPMFYVLLKSVV